MSLSDSGQAGDLATQVKVTPKMIEVGVAALLDLQESEVGQSYLVERVYRAMRVLEPSPWQVLGL